MTKGLMVSSYKRPGSLIAAEDFVTKLLMALKSGYIPEVLSSNHTLERYSVGWNNASVEMASVPAGWALSEILYKTEYGPVLLLDLYIMYWVKVAEVGVANSSQAKKSLYCFGLTMILDVSWIIEFRGWEGVVSEKIVVVLLK